MTLTARAALIHTATKELVMRRNAQPHLGSMRAILNASAISRLEDKLTTLHIEQIEASDALIAEAEANVAATNAQIEAYMADPFARLVALGLAQEVR